MVFSWSVVVVMGLGLMSGSLIGWLVVYELVTIVFLVYMFEAMSMCQVLSEILLWGVMISVFVVAVVVSAYVRSLRVFGGQVVWASSLGVW